MKLRKLLLPISLSFGALFGETNRVEAQITITVGTGTTPFTGVNGLPIYRNSAINPFNYSQSASLYTTTDLSSLPNNATITAIAFNKTTVASLSTGCTATFNILMKNTTSTALNGSNTWGTYTLGATTVYANTALDNITLAATPWVTFPLNTGFVYTGGSLEIYTDWSVNTGTGNPTTADFPFGITSTTSIQSVGNSSTLPLNSSTILSSTGTRLNNIQITYTASAACSGAPVAGTATTTGTNVCVGNGVTIGLTGGTAASGLSFQLQSSANNTTFTNIGTASTSPSFPVVTTVGTTYYRIVTTCTAVSQTANSTSVTVAGLGAVTTFPYTDTFSSSGLPSCWSASAGTGAAYNWTGTASDPSYGASAPQSGSGFLYLNVYSAQTLYNPYLLNSRPYTLNSTPKRLQYYYFLGNVGYKGTTGATGTDPYPLMVLATNNGGTSYDTLFNHSASNSTFATSNATSFWTQNTIQLPASYANQTVKFRFVSRSNYASGIVDQGLDEVAVMDVPSCTAPATVTATNVTFNTATISWTASTSAPTGGYQYEVRTSGVAGTGATGLVTSGSTAAGVFTASITGLAGTTNYTVYVRSNCGSGSFSTWNFTSFTTSIDCSTAPVISACGVSQTFIIPTGTGVWNLNTATPAGPYNTPGIEKLYKFTPATTGLYTLNVTAASGTYADYFIKPVSAGCNMSGFTFIKDFNATGTNTTGLNLTAGTQYYLLIDLEGTATATTQTFSLNCPLTCAVPLNLAASALTTTGATLSWTQPAMGTPAQWQISYGPTGTIAAVGTKITVTTNPYNLTGLTAATGYTAYVRAICGVGDTSAFSASVNFTTQCVASTLPFVENFATVPPACWSLASSGLSVAPSSPVTVGSNGWGLDQYLNNAANGTAARINLFTSTKRDWLISQSINLGSTVGNFELGFKVGIVAYSSSTAVTSPVGATLGSDDTLAVLVSTNNGASWSTANIVQIFTAANTPISATGNQQYTVILNNLSGQVKVAFYASEGTTPSTDNDVFVDSVTLKTSPCNSPIVSLGNDTSICTGNTLTLNAGNAGAAYLWSTGATTQTISVTNAGSYSVRVTNSGGCTSRDTIVTTVGPAVVAGTITVTGQVPTFTFTASGNQNDSLRGWRFGDGTGDASGNSTTTSHTYMANGTYEVKFYVIGDCGEDSASVMVTVSNIGVNTVLLNGEVTLFPNPSSDIVTIKNSSTQTMKHITVLNVVGAVVREVDATNGKEQHINISELAAGSYMIRVQLDGATIVRRLQITK